MERGMKIVLILYGAVHVVLGVPFIIAPQWTSNIFGIGEIAVYVPYLMALLGGAFIALAFLLIVAGLNPLEHITVVKYAILHAILGTAMGVYAIITGSVDFSVAGMGIILDAVFAIAFLSLYPYRRS